MKLMNEGIVWTSNYFSTMSPRTNPSNGELGIPASPARPRRSPRPRADHFRDVRQGIQHRLANFRSVV